MSVPAYDGAYRIIPIIQEVSRPSRGILRLKARSGKEQLSGSKIVHRHS